jgi:PAS domain S-box-containing protein
LHIRRYGIAIGSVGVAFAVRLGLGGILETSVPFITFYPAVVFATTFGGLGPGILASILSLAAVFSFFNPVRDLRLDLVRAGIFVGFSILFSIFNETLRRARARGDRDRELLLITLSSIGDGVISTDAAGNITFLNVVAERLTGWSQADAKGKAIAEVFVVRNEITGLPAEIAVDKVIYDGVLRSKDGRDIPIEESAAPICDEQKTVRGMVLVFRDVGERKRSEDALKRSESRLKLALDAGRIGVWDWDLTDNHVAWSDRVYDIYGIERDGFGGTVDEFTRLVHPEDRPGVDASIRAALEDGVPYEPEFRAIHPAKGVRWMSNCGQVHRNEKGEPVRMLGSVSDITDRKEAEALVLQQWHAFDTALSNTPDFTYLFDLEGRFTYINRALLALWQRRLEDSVGKNFSELEYPPELAARLQMQIQTVIESKEPLRDQTPFTGADGQTGAYEYIFVPVFGKDGRVEAVAGSTRDISHQKRVEEELKRSNDELLRVNRELEEFAYVASHDLQEPLRMVNIYTQLILDDVGADWKAMNEYAGFVQQGVRRMEGLIQDLLTFSRAVHSDPSTVGSADLSAALDEALSVLKNRIEESGCTLTREMLPKVYGDGSQMAHVFQNLVSNALKYRRPGIPPAVHVAAKRDREYWIISVQDNGIGFEPKYAERIFGLFKRLYKEEYPGTGLGLAICKRIVERYGGRVWAEGRPGEGATFYFSLPVADLQSR